MPPRHVPLSLKIANYCNGLAQVGWIFFGFGMIFFWIFSANSDLSFLTFRGPHPTAQGVVLAVVDTGASEDEVRVQANHYEYSVAGRSFHGISYTTGSAAGPGASVTVEYDPAQPERSRIAGMRRSLFGPAAALAILFPLIGLVLVILAGRIGAKRNRLLRDGLLATGTLTKKSATSMKVNQQPVFELTFAFTTRDGRRCETKTRTHLPARLEDEAQEPLLYDPNDPKVAYILDEAPARPQFELNGELRGHGLGALSYLLVPLLVVAAHGAFAAVKLGFWQW
jgi:hypothetical protein